MESFLQISLRLAELVLDDAMRQSFKLFCLHLEELEHFRVHAESLLFVFLNHARTNFTRLDLRDVLKHADRPRGEQERLALESIRQLEINSSILADFLIVILGSSSDV